LAIDLNYDTQNEETARV